MVELEGPILWSRLKAHEPPPFNLATPIQIQATISCDPPTGHEPSKSKLVFCSCTTEGELSQNKYGQHLRNGVESPFDGKWVNFSAVPKDEVERVYEEVDKFIMPLRASSLRLVRLLRWRAGLDFQALTINQDYLSLDGHPWLSVSAARSMTLDLVQIFPAMSEEITKEIIDQYESSGDEPLAHQLFNDAWNLRNTNPRASLVVAVAAAEVGLKKVIGLIVPDAQWLLEEIPAPPIGKILRKYIPTLKVKSSFTGKQIIPPSKLIEKLENAARARNKVVHIGEKAPEYKELVEMLEAVRDFLWVCDLYRGQLKNVSFISSHVLKEWKNTEDIDQRGEPKSRCSIIIHDDIRIGIDNGGFVPRKFDTESANPIACFRHGFTESAFGPIDTLAPENAPWFAFNLVRSLSGQFFKFWIGIDNPLPGFHLGNYDRDRHLIEEAPELLALQSVGQMGRGEQLFNLVGLSFFRHADPGNFLSHVETLTPQLGSNR